ncbi:MAG: hypothetical protein KBS89_00845 [Bacteroidales bacterium]|nr:hypothetical protein [Candidatus Egerieousia equi]
MILTNKKQDKLPMLFMFKRMLTLFVLEDLNIRKDSRAAIVVTCAGHY